MPREWLRALALIIFAVGVACSGPPQYRTLTSESPTPVSSASAAAIADPFEARYRAASAAVTLFHLRFDQRNFARIYASADESLRASTTEAAFTSRLAAQRDRVGATRSEDELRVDIAERGQDLAITIVLETIFENATLVETFVWRVTPNETTYLLRYDTR